MATVVDRPSELLTREQAAAFLGVKTNTLAVWVTTQRYHLPFIKVGSKVRYRLSDLEAFLDERTVDPQANGDRPARGLRRRLDK